MHPLILILTLAGADAEQLPVQMPALIQRFREDRSDLESFYAVASSRRTEERKRRFFEDWQKGLTVVEFDRLSRADQVDWLLLKNEVAHERNALLHRARRIEEVERLLPVAVDIVALEERRRAMEPIEPQAAAEALVAIAAGADTAKAGLKPGGEVAPAVAKRLAERVGELRRMLDHWFDYHDGYDPQFSWWSRASKKSADEALTGLENHLVREIAQVRGAADDPILGDPIGRAALLDDLAHEMIPYSPEELMAIGEREFAWCEREMLRAAADLGFAADWRGALEHVKQQYVPPGQQDRLIRDLAREAIAFLDERDLVTIPDLCRETWRIEMMSPQRQKTSPFFLYGGQHIIVSYPTDAMSHEQKLMSMRANNIHFSRATVQHELIPGHHLQGFMADRHATWRRLFSTPFFGEGWALYWEMRLWDLGFPRTAEDRIGMLFWRMHRCARILVSLGFHLETMTPAQMIDVLVDRVGHERDSATAEVRRYVGGDYGPLYQCAYLIGGKQLYALQRERVGSGRMTEREFHDAVLRQNSIPVEMVRAALGDVILTADHTPSWRFEQP